MHHFALILSLASAVKSAYFLYSTGWRPAKSKAYVHLRMFCLSRSCAENFRALREIRHDLVREERQALQDLVAIVNALRNQEEAFPDGKCL